VLSTSEKKKARRKRKVGKRRMKDAPGTRDYDWWLVAILAVICALGVIEIYSATHGSALAGCI